MKSNELTSNQASRLSGSEATKQSRDGSVEKPSHCAVVGLDVGDRKTCYCTVDLNGDLLSEGKLQTKPCSARLQFEGQPRMRIALEAGVHSAWMSRLLVKLGHEVIVANARNLRLISESDSKNDKADARLLARLARVGADLLSPIEHRNSQVQADLTIIRARESVVTARTKLINAVRGLVKQTGERMPNSCTATFAHKAEEACPEELRPALLPLIRMIERLSEEIRLYDKMILTKAEKEYPATKQIRTIPGVGALTALGVVLVLNNNPHQFRKSRDVGCYFGLRPQQKDSGERSPQLGITKAGDRVMRRILVQSAQYILGPFGKDTGLRRWGLAIALRGGKNAKKRAVVAVARKLVILMHRLWVTNEEFDPTRGMPKALAA
jgi:transposase